MLVVEINKKGHNERPLNYEKKRQEDLEKVGYYFSRTNSDKPGFDDYDQFGRVSSHIAESMKKQTEESTKTSLIDDLSKWLLELKFGQSV